MKTFFTRLFIRFEAISHPAGGWFKNNEKQQKRKTLKGQKGIVVSPDSFNVRGGSKKGTILRRTPAP